MNTSQTLLSTQALTVRLLQEDRLRIDLYLDGNYRKTFELHESFPPEEESVKGSPLLLTCVSLKQKELARHRAKDASPTATERGYGTLKMHLSRYMGKRRLPVGRVDKAFCLGFISYLDHCTDSRLRDPSAQKPLTPNTKKQLVAMLNTVLNKAVRNDYLSSNPMDKLDSDEKPRLIPSDRPHLTREELRLLGRHPCPSAQVGQAFLFSCFCGLRWSDVKSLRWSDIHCESGSYIVVKRMVKTGRWLSAPLNKEALRMLPDGDRQSDNLVFDLPSPQTANTLLGRWCRAAGIDKKVTFHIARHTFATLILTLGADIYTTSKLLGHTNVSTTQIYASVVDEKKIQAVNLMNGLMD